MRVFDSLDQLPEFKRTVFTQGTFDGVHLGHQKILQRIEQEALKIGGESVLLTFWPHPRLLLFPDDNNLKLLQTLDEKLEVLSACGVDNVVVIPFTKEFSHIMPEDFIKDILVNKFNVHTAIIGYDHRFGRNREGDISLMRKFSGIYHYDLIEIGAEDINHITISSTKIRNALLSGDIETANRYIGRPYSFKGTVVEGMKLGRELGFPTANILIDNAFKLIPANGVYAVKCVVWKKEFGGMMSIGNNPTVKGKNFSIEVNIFDFNDTIYGEAIEIKLIAWLREEKKFENLEELSLNLQLDKKNALDKIGTL
jgi:riboflavin kinase / FMN adenylyltransferase